MRLTCPNCGTEYEVPEDLIPEDGKHVQCSGCHTRWFARGGDTTLLSEEQIIHRLESWSPRPVAVPTPPAPDTAAGTEAASDPEASESTEEEPQSPSELVPEPVVADPGGPAALQEPESEPASGARRDPDRPKQSGVRPASGKARPRPLTAEPEATTDDLPETFIWEKHDSAGAAAPSWQEPVSPAQDVPRPGQQARPRPSQRLELPRAVVPPVFDDPPPTRSRFWRGVMVPAVVAGLVLAAYFWTDLIVARWPAFEPVLGALAERIDAGREWAEALLGPMRSG